ncbi:MAG: peptidoglycan-associated lipoprotein Pal [Candidatus Manganitrophaceae bacterium]
MNKSFCTTVGIFTLFFALVFVGCSKKATPVEGTAALPKEQPAAERPPAPPAPIVPDTRDTGERLLPPPPIEKDGGLSSGAEETLPPVAAFPPSTGAENGEGDTSLADVFFDFDQWILQSEAKKVLEADAQWLTANPRAKIQIEGHADERGTEEYNLALGERRAKSVANFLLNLGVSASRISSISYGEEKPFCSEKTEVCYQKNRRAHFVLSPR